MTKKAPALLRKPAKAPAKPTKDEKKMALLGQKKEKK